MILPTIMRCYSQRQTNPLLGRIVEFACKQFYILHRKPFILQVAQLQPPAHLLCQCSHEFQLFGSVAPLLDIHEAENEFNPMKVLWQKWEKEGKVGRQGELRWGHGS